MRLTRPMTLLSKHLWFTFPSLKLSCLNDSIDTPVVITEFHDIYFEHLTFSVLLVHLLLTLWCPFGLNLGKAADKAAEGYVGSQDKSALVDASTGLERQVEDAGGANEAETVGTTEGLIKMKGTWATQPHKMEMQNRLFLQNPYLLYLPRSSMCFFQTVLSLWYNL